MNMPQTLVHQVKAQLECLITPPRLEGTNTTNQTQWSTSGHIRSPNQISFRTTSNSYPSVYLSSIYLVVTQKNFGHKLTLVSTGSTEGSGNAHF